MMRDIGVLFRSEMVRAQLDGRKWQTRRMAWRDSEISGTYEPDREYAKETRTATRWQSVKPGDRLWVRENCRGDGEPGNKRPGIARYSLDGEMVLTDGTDHLWEYKRRVMPAIHMPRTYSRLTWIVTGVRMEHVQDISNADAIAEGAHNSGFGPGATNYANPRDAFRALWYRIHGAASWDQNPELVVIIGKVYHLNIDHMENAT